MNFGEMKYRVRQLVGQTDTNSTMFNTTTDLEPAINDACASVAARTECLLTFWDYETVAGTQNYSLKPDYLKMKALQLFVAADNKYTLKHLSFDEFSQYEGGNPTTQGVPRVYKIEIGATDTSTNLPGDFWVYPVPDTNGGSQYIIRAYYFQIPTDLVADADITELPIIAHKAVCLEAAMTLSMMAADKGMYRDLSLLLEREIGIIRGYAGIGQRDSATRMKDTLNIARRSRVVRRG